MKRVTGLILTILLLSGLVGFVPAVSAQQSNDYHLFGDVKDNHGKPVPGAVIILKEKNGWKEVKIKADEHGHYDRWFIHHNVYDVRVEKEGFVTTRTVWNLSPYEDQPIEKKIDLVLISKEEMKKAKRFEQVKKDYETAFKALQKNDCKKAVKKANAVVQAAPEYFGGYFILGRCAMQNKDVDTAITAYRKALTYKNDIPEGHYDLGNLYVQKKDIDHAIEEYRKVLDLQPDHVDAQFNIGALYYNRKQWKEAITFMTKVLENKQDYSKAYQVLGYAYAQTGSFDKAAENFRRYLQLQPDASDRKAAEEIIKAAESMKPKKATGP